MNDNNFESLFAQRNPDHAFLLREMRNALGIAEVTFDDLTTNNLRKVTDYLLKGRSNSSVRTYMAVIKASINDFSADGFFQNNGVTKAVRVKNDVCENIALTEDEINRFMNYYTTTGYRSNRPAEHDVLTLFLCELVTGARTSDVENLTSENLCGNILSYVSQKTHTLTRIPAHKMLPMLLENMPKKKYSRVTKCRVIKEVAKSIGITQMETRNYRGVLKARPRYEYLGTHSARRSCISLLLDKGVPLATVSKWVGHRSPAMTLHYYCSDSMNMNEEAMAFFNG